MPRSLLLPTALSSAVLAAALLASCDPICLDGVSSPGPGREYQNVSGTCVAVVVTSPDSGGSDGGTDAGDGGEEPDAGPGETACGKSGWTRWVVDEGLDVLTAGFAFDAQGVGHYAFSRGSHLYVGTTRPGDVPVQISSVWTAYDVHLAMGADGTHHVLFQQGEYFGYAHDTRDGWKTQLLGKGYAGAIAVDAQGAPHVFAAQASANSRGYLYGTRTDGVTWSLAPILETTLRGDRERLVVDASGHAHAMLVNSLDLTHQVEYATNRSGTWTTEPLAWVVPPMAPRLRLSLALDSAGRPNILGSDGEGASLWVREESGWTPHGMGPFMSRGPALSLGPGNAGWALLDDADPAAGSLGTPSHLIVKTLHQQSPVSATPPLRLETLDGGNAFPGPSSVYADTVDGLDRVQVGFAYVHYDTPPDGGLLQTTRGLGYARYCP